MYTYNCTIIRILDGDTVEANIDLGFSCHYVSVVRLKGIDAPELSGDTKTAGLAAKNYLATLLSAGPTVVITTELRKDKDKYGRVLGTFYANGLNVNQAMIDAGHAVQYGRMELNGTR